MATTQELQSLLERVEKATGPDSELDEAIRFQFDPMGSVFYSEHSAYTASIDAALALVERVLPGAAYVLNAFRVATKPDDVWMFKCHLSDGCSGIADGRTQALAILAAMLRALIAQDDEVAA